MSRNQEPNAGGGQGNVNSYNRAETDVSSGHKRNASDNKQASVSQSLDAFDAKGGAYHAKKGSDALLAPVKGKSTSNKPIQEEITHESLINDTADLMANASRLDEILENELIHKGKNPKKPTSVQPAKDGKIFPYEDELY